MAIYLKDPAAVIDYAVDWAAAYLAGATTEATTEAGAVATIVDSSWAVVPGGLAIATSRHDAGRSTATLSGGTRGCVYRLTNRVTFSDGRSDERSLDVRVEDR